MTQFLLERKENTVRKKRDKIMLDTNSFFFFPANIFNSLLPQGP